MNEDIVHHAPLPLAGYEGVLNCSLCFPYSSHEFVPIDGLALLVPSSSQEEIVFVQM